MNYEMRIVSLDQAYALLNDPNFRVRDMRMGQAFDSWEVYWEFITPDRKWYRVVVPDHGDTGALALYKGCWNFGMRNAPHLYGLLDSKEEANA